MNTLSINLIIFTKIINNSDNTLFAGQKVISQKDSKSNSKVFIDLLSLQWLKKNNVTKSSSIQILKDLYSFVGKC